MIRVLLISKEGDPSSLRTKLEKFSEVEIVNGPPVDVIVVYCALWNRTALARVKQIRNETQAPAVVICERTDEPFRKDSLFHGEVSGVLPVQATGEQLVACLRAAAAGLKVFQDFSNRNHSEFHHPVLTLRELEVLRLIADGEGNKSIADLLEISEHTVKFHISSIFEKLHVSSRTEAIKAGIRNGLISI